MKARVISISVASLVLAGCAADGSLRPLTHTETGALIGAAGGAVIGAAAYRKTRTKGALVGAVGGGLAGGAV